MQRKVYENYTVSRTAKAALLLAVLSAGAASAQEQAPPERRVSAVRFEGNRAVDDLILGASIATTAPRGFFLLVRLGGGERQPFDELEFRRDVLRIQLLYRRFGYFEARVDTVVRRNGDKVAVTFRISEGPPVIVDSVVVGGLDSIIPQERLLRRLPIRAGKPFNRFEFEAAADTLVTLLRNRGYPFPEVFRNYSVDRLTRLARIEFDAIPGAFARIGAMNAVGSRTVTDRTIRRSAGISVGDPYSQQRLTQAQLGLYRTDMFRYASVTVDPDSPLVNRQDSLVRLRIAVSDAPPVRLRAGVGYGTYDCLRASSQFSWVNFLGGARRIDATSRVSKLGSRGALDLGLSDNICSALSGDRFSERLNYANDVTLTQPALLGRPVQLGFTVFAERSSEYKAYERVAAGVAVTAGTRLGVPVSLRYRVERGRTDADNATFCIAFDQCEASTVAQLAAYRRQSTLTLTFSDVRTNSPIDPSRGRAWTFQAATARPALGSQVAFDRVLAEAAWYRPLRPGWVGAARLRAGAVRAGEVTAGGSTFRFIPPSERFYAGGATSVRGFSRNAMGPIVYVADFVPADPMAFPDSVIGLRSSPLGSSAVALANVELRTPAPFLPQRLGFAIFVDAGELWQETPTGQFIPSGVRITPGAGIRMATPLGPMRLDIGYNDYPDQRGRLYLVSGDQLELKAENFPPPRQRRFINRLTWHFSVGQAF
jgi:outer membrane protein insertion porin family